MFLVFHRKVGTIFTLNKTTISDFWSQSTLTHNALHCNAQSDVLQELVSWIWWLSVVSTLFYVVFFAVGPGSIPWMITAELFSQGPR